LAHKKFRENAEILSREKMKIGERKVSLLDWFNDIFKLKPEIEEEFEGISASIFDKTAPIFEDRELVKLIPNLKTIVEQLESWGVLHPIPTELIYEEIYRELSEDVHVFPDKTDIGRRLLQKKDLFETTVIPEELDKFLDIFHKVIDIGIVIELNILSDWIEQNGEVKAKLKERLPILKDLELSYGYQCLKEHLKRM
jgi:hypothetical protein